MLHAVRYLPPSRLPLCFYYSIIGDLKRVLYLAIPSLCDLSSFLMSNTTSHKRSIPPLFPIHSTYTAFYCEENVYLLTKQFLENEEIRELWDVFAVFISNSTRTVRHFLVIL